MRRVAYWALQGAILAQIVLRGPAHSLGAESLLGGANARPPHKGRGGVFEAGRGDALAEWGAIYLPRIYIVYALLVRSFRGLWRFFRGVAGRLFSRIPILYGGNMAWTC